MKPLKKEAKIAIGASITVVILALIAVIVVVAVNSAKNITQMFGTVYTAVEDTVRDNRYIATIKNRYALMEGDKVLASNFTQLQFAEKLDGYVFAEDNGDSGILNKDGKKRYSYTINEINLRKADSFSGDIVTLSNGEAYNIKTKERIEALTKIKPKGEQTGTYKYFTAVSDKFVVITVESNMAISATTNDGKVYAFSSPTQSEVKLVASNGTDYVLEISGSSCLIANGVAILEGQYQSAYVLNDESFIGFYAVNGTIYDSAYKSTNISVPSGKTMKVFESYLDSGESVYKCDNGDLKIVVSEAELYYSINDTCYILGGSTVYELSGKVLTSATSGNTIKAVTNKFIYEGNTVRTIKGDKKITDVTEIYSNEQTKFSGQFDFSRDVVAKKTDGTVHSLKLGEIYGKTQIDKLGEISFKQGNILQFNYGYIFKNDDGFYCNTNDTFYNKETYSEMFAIGFATNRDCYATISNGIMQVYKIGKTVTNVTGLYYKSLSMVSYHENGVIFSIETGAKGFINLEGKAIAEPVYKSIEYTDEYLVIEISSAKVKGILSFLGKELTNYRYVSIMPMGDFGCVEKADGTYSVINSSGREVLTNVSAPEQMKNTVLVGGKYVIDNEFKYFKVCEPRGWRVIKTPITKY